MSGHAATVNWRLGAWSDYDGYPSSVGQYEERLVWAATERQPTTVWATVAQALGIPLGTVFTPRGRQVKLNNGGTPIAELV